MDSLLQEYNLSTEQKEKFKIYYQFLIKENEKINLTAIVDLQEVYIKHFYDSLAMSKVVDLNEKSLCDIGSGAGFPSIPLKILIPSLQVTIIEPTTKRVKFLIELCNLLEFSDVNIINGRAEDVINGYRDSYDIVTARAVASLNILLELTIPFVKVNGLFISYKGQSYLEELNEAKNALLALDATLKEKCEYDLLNNFGKRCLLIFTKSKKTNPKYPRIFKDIKNKSL